MSNLLTDVVRRQAKQRGAAPALTGGGRTVTYAALDNSTNQIAQALVAFGTSTDSRIGYLTKASVEAAEVLVGCAKAGLVAVPLNWRLAVPELIAVAQDAGLAVILAEPEFLPAAAAVADAVGGIPVVDLASRAWIEAQPNVDPGLDSDAGTVLLQIYTSGTTGLPKGVQLTLGNLAYTEEGLAIQGFTQHSVAVNVLPMFHVAGQAWLVCSLIAGGHSIMMPDFQPAELIALMESERVTNICVVPAMLQVLTAMPGIEQRDFSALEVIVYGASPITPALLRRSMDIFGCEFVQFYGMTETSGGSTCLTAKDHDPDGPRQHLLRSAGKPLVNVEVRIVGTDSSELLPAGQVGEVQTRSPHNTPGYFDRPLDNAALFTNDGWLRTGDAGYLDDDGYLFITDRLKDMVITGGENVYPVEVEAVLADHPAIAEVAVIGTPDVKWGEAVTAVVVVKPGLAAPSEQDIIDFTAGKLASYKKPRIVKFIEALPRNPSGKILKRELRSSF
jgi:acyl-CoA synthetase (AMP-forming)/AMP-acid ligase II